MSKREAGAVLVLGVLLALLGSWAATGNLGWGVLVVGAMFVRLSAAS